MLKFYFVKKKNFKYGNIKFSAELANVFGYHYECFNKVIVMKSKYKDDFDAFFKSQAIPKFSTSHDDQDPSATSTKIVSATSQQLPDASHSTVADINSTEAQSCTSASLDPRNDTHSLASVTISPIAIEKLRSYENQIKIEESDNETSEEALSSISIKNTACIFCGHKTKRVGKKKMNVTFSQAQSTIDTISRAAKAFDDTRLLSKLDNQKAVPYHAACFSTYHVRFKRQTTDRADDSYWHTNRDIHKQAFNALGNFIEEEVIKKKKIFYLTQLLSRYKALLLEFGEEKVCLADFEAYRAENLERKILTVYGDRLIIEASTGSLRKKILYADDIDVSMLDSESMMLETKNHEKLEDVAFDLRYCVKTHKRRRLSENLRVNGVIKNEFDIPKELYDFMSNLVEGPDVNSKNPDGNSVTIESLCSDIINAIT
ncbi:uncharacterized protein LOC130669358 [Microplitis mediator]|uniref:uncharacterized protein LOC130669358 n=1 Tax=Microplitis mediator TaxID=375433 RepID=UPI002553791E|nr:uncharacterized protein LOC130669358 [Microplitis mediator]XP_057328170.1 uncharacterized protein LOC130669358 [Microplitis mediator]XP_057328171.1 uncharacterized protein LOC130669358 [Microplitis mediator]XP_057328172.1 uncharacterized protein LOC130669358 [Microplitis mediator]XP_057328173.1 uncharacterized protein LOC130669358 [Microplitis mediator]XP_057328174.1 uncharacterized protein LOC130669358 [Microplitis mediator]